MLAMPARRDPFIIRLWRSLNPRFDDAALERAWQEQRYARLPTALGFTALYATVVLLSWVAVVPDKYRRDPERDDTLWWDFSAREYAKYTALTAALWAFALAFRARRCRPAVEPLLVSYYLAYAVCTTWSSDRWAMDALCGADCGDKWPVEMRQRFRELYTECWTTELHLIMLLALMLLARLRLATSVLLASLSLCLFLGTRLAWALPPRPTASEALEVLYPALEGVVAYASALLVALGCQRLELLQRSDFAEAAAHRAAMRNELTALRARHEASEAEREALATALGSVPERLQHARIDQAELEVGERLGSGAFAEVRRAKWRATPVALKVLHRCNLDAHHLAAFKEECELMLGLRHPNIVQMLGGAWSLESADVCLVLELCARGTLESLLADGALGPTLSWRVHKLPIATGIARALAYLHALEPPLIHRDLKPANVLLDEAFNAKLADFGVSRDLARESTMTQRIGTPRYSAPELLRLERYDERVDVWSFGCVLEVLWTHEEIFEKEERRLEVRRRSSGVLSFIADDTLRPCLPPGSFLAPLVAGCTAAPQERLAAREVVAQLEAPDLLGPAMVQPAGPAAGERRRCGSDPVVMFEASAPAPARRSSHRFSALFDAHAVRSTPRKQRALPSFKLWRPHYCAKGPAIAEASSAVRAEKSAPACSSRRASCELSGDVSPSSGSAREISASF